MTVWRRGAHFIGLMSWLLVVPAFAQQTVLTGPARVHGADLLSIDGQRIFLWGVDAPEPGQICKLNGRDWACYDASLRQLETLSSRADLTCYLVGDPDPFGRHHGVCEVGSENINAEMVRSGMAIAYPDQSKDYMNEQLEAISAQAGLWQPGVEFLEPWIHRSITTDSTNR